MPGPFSILLAVLAPMLCGAGGLLLPRRLIGARVGLALLGPVVALLLLGTAIAQHGLDGVILSAPWMPEVNLNIAFHLDRLGLFFALLVAGIGVLIVTYARAYFGPNPDDLYRFYPSLGLFMTAMLGLVLSDNFILLLLFWEMTSISSFLLIGWERDDPKAVKNALQAFIVTGTGGLCLLAGLILLGVITGAWAFSELSPQLITPDGLTIAAFVLIFVGAAGKSAQWPLHFWLPGAMAAPTPVSAYLHSATMVKAGVYLIGRLWPLLAVAIPLWPALIVPFGTVTMVLGAYIALRKSDLKQIFAYTTVSQLGLLMTMYGLSALEFKNQPNLIWDISQILNHALYKAPLFLLAGAIAHVAHTRELPELKGLYHQGGQARIMAGLMILAGYALAAGPLTVSFSAKEFFFYQIWHGYEATHHPGFFILVAAGVATGMFNVAIFVRLTRVLLGSSEVKPAQPPHPPGHDVHGQHDYRAPLTAGLLEQAHAQDDGQMDTHGHGGHAHGHGGHGHHDHHEAGFWPTMLWVPAALVIAVQYIGGIIPGAWEALFGRIEAGRFYFSHFPMTWDAHLGVPLGMSVAAMVLGLLLGFAPVFTRTIRDIHDGIFPAFYTASTQGGGWAFRLVQTGNARTYLAVIFVSMIVLIIYALLAGPKAVIAGWHDIIEDDHFRRAAPEYFIGAVVCFAAILLPIVKDRASRILVLGTVGFGVAGLFYLYQAPDLALTQISIEIVSLFLFLLVLGLLPQATFGRAMRFGPRLVISVLAGGLIGWLALTSSSGPRPPMPYLKADTQEPFAHLGEFFLRNSYEGRDGERGGGGGNVVNVILVDFRGYDTLGEIVVLGLAALGVWTLLRRRTLHQSTRALRLNLDEHHARQHAHHRPARSHVPERSDGA